jgi:hypothetical protein
MDSGSSWRQSAPKVSNECIVSLSKNPARQDFQFCCGRVCRKILQDFQRLPTAYCRSCLVSGWDQLNGPRVARTKLVEQALAFLYELHVGRATVVGTLVVRGLRGV